MKLERILHFMAAPLASLSGDPGVRAVWFTNGENVLKGSMLTPAHALIGREVSDCSDLQEYSRRSRLGQSSLSQEPFPDMAWEAAENGSHTPPLLECPRPYGTPGCT